MLADPNAVKPEASVMNRAIAIRHLRGLFIEAAPRSLLRARYQRRFFSSRGWNNLHFGMFESFEEAAAFARTHQVESRYTLDHVYWSSRQAALKPHDYPVLFWLDRLLAADSTVVDFGGSVGVSYYLYAERSDKVRQARWTVCELPEAVELGRRIAADRGIERLTFTQDRGVMSGATCLLSAGTLQFIDRTLDQLLADMNQPPPHILVYRIALAVGVPGFITLQNTGTSIAPCRVGEYSQFVSSVRAQGYELVDHWKCLENMLEVPLHPESKLNHFHGFYFRRSEQPGAADRAMGPSATQHAARAGSTNPREKSRRSYEKSQ
jgi:putative methyltransferase (TIGR04325 family)